MICSIESLEHTQVQATAVSRVNRRRLPILRYRSIPHHSPETAAPRSVPAARLEEHLSFLVAAGFRALGVTDALRVLHEDGRRRVVALTFDDALLDFLNAFELLNLFGARATLYVPTATVGRRVSRWDREPSRLGWWDLQDIAAAGFEIGSQSVSSRPLDGRPDTVVRTEVRDSKKEIEDRLGLRVESFCFPAGYSSSRLRDAVSAAGYSNACGMTPRVARAQDDVFNLPRLRVKPSATGNKIDALLRTGGGHGSIPALQMTKAPLQVARRTATWIAVRAPWRGEQTVRRRDRAALE
jgi:peptidoglycan/xylan/chitin deacetylase (PgdA/CDA1 family)